MIISKTKQRNTQRINYIFFYDILFIDLNDLIRIPIDFDCEHQFVAKEIKDVIINGFLSTEIVSVILLFLSFAKGKFQLW